MSTLEAKSALTDTTTREDTNLTITIAIVTIVTTNMKMFNNIATATKK